MLTNWTNEEARRLSDLLEAKFGTVLSFCYEDSTRDQFGARSHKSTGRKITLRVYLDAGDKSSRVFETTYETNNHPSVKPVTVYAYAKREGNGVNVWRRFEGTDNPVRASETHNPDLLPTSLEAWVDKTVEVFTELDKEFEQKSAVYIAALKIKEEFRAKRMCLSDLVEDGKLTTVKLKDYKYNCGDKRSCGSLRVVAETDAGELILESSLGSSGDLEDMTVTLGGVERDDDTENEFDPGTPHYYSGRRAVDTWEESAEETLQDALEKWLFNS